MDVRASLSFLAFKYRTFPDRFLRGATATLHSIPFYHAEDESQMVMVIPVIYALLVLLYNPFTMEPLSQENIRVLLADPDTAFCIAARHSLEKNGFAVTLAHDGADLMARFAPDQFDAVVAGVGLRRPSGLDILRHIKKNAPAIPVILLCDEKSEETAESGIREGAFTYLRTSINDLGELADSIMEAIENPPENSSPDAIDGIAPSKTTKTVLLLPLCSLLFIGLTCLYKHVKPNG